MIDSCLKLHYYLPGYLVTDKMGNKVKYIAPEYTYVKNLKGNTPNTEIRYLQIRNDGNLVNHIITYFPEYTALIQHMESLILKKVKEMYNKYVDIKIHKKWYNLEKIEKEIIYNIHARYLQTKHSITIQSTYEVFCSLPYYKLAMVLKIPLNKHK